MEKLNVYVTAKVHYYQPPNPELNQVRPYFPSALGLQSAETTGLTYEVAPEIRSNGYPNQVTPTQSGTLYPSYSGDALEVKLPEMGKMSYKEPSIVLQPEIGHPPYKETTQSAVPDVNRHAVGQPSITAEASLIEQQIFNLVNKERAIHGLPPLQLNPGLHQVAKRKSLNMGELGYFNHNGPDGKTTMDWLIEKGYSFSAWGENIANFKAHAKAEEIMQGWMNSPGHRANILANNFTLLGVGVYPANGRTFATQVFGRID